VANTDVHGSTQDDDKQDLAAEWAEVNARLDSLLDSVGKGRPRFHAPDDSTSRRDPKHPTGPTSHYASNRYSGNLRLEPPRKTLLTANDPVVLLVSLGALAVSLFPVAPWARVLAGVGGIAGLLTSLASGTSNPHRPRNGTRYRYPRNHP